MLPKILHFLIQLLIVLVFIHALASWFPQLRESRFYWYLDKLIEPMLAPLRRILPPVGGLDLSPAILIFILIVIDRLLAR